MLKNLLPKTKIAIGIPHMEFIRDIRLLFHRAADTTAAIEQAVE